MTVFENSSQFVSRKVSIGQGLMVGLVASLALWAVIGFGFRALFA